MQRKNYFDLPYKVASVSFVWILNSLTRELQQSALEKNKSHEIGRSHETLQKLHSNLYLPGIGVLLYEISQAVLM